MIYVPKIGKNTGKVISLVLEQSMDGYMLLSRTGLNETELSEAVAFLKSNDLVGVEGCTTPEAIRSSYVYVPPSAKGNAQLALRNFLSQSNAP